MGMMGEDSDDEREFKLAFERYKNIQKPERRKDERRNEVTQVKKKKPKEPKENDKVLRDICIKEFENQGAIPKAIYNQIKSNEVLLRNHSKDGKKKSCRERNSSQLPDPEKQVTGKSVTRGNNSGSGKKFAKGSTSKRKVIEPFKKSFYYLVPQEPSPDFFLPPGLHYEVSKPLDLSIEKVDVCHPQRSEKGSSRDGTKTGKHNRKHVERFAVSPNVEVNDLNKSERNRSNVTLARELISKYNSGKCKAEILAEIKTVKSNLETEIEGFKSVLAESTTALDELTTLEFSLNYKSSSDKRFENEELNIKKDFKGKESREENGTEVNSPTGNRLVNKEGGEGGLDVKNSSANQESTPSEEEITKEDALLAKTQDLDTVAEEYSGESAEGFSEEREKEDKIKAKILEITSLLSDISGTYLRTELEKMGDDVNSINTFIDDLFENRNYPKIQVDPEEDKRKQLWKEYVTDFNPKKFLFELSIVSPKDAATRDGNDNDDINLVSAFLRRRYPTMPLADLMDSYDKSRNIAEVCESYDEIVTPVRLSESGFWLEKFDKEFLIKVIYLDHQYEIDDYLSGIQERKKLEKEEAKLCNSFLHCLTCFSEIVPSDTSTCSEGHIFCSNCVEGYIRVELGKGTYKFKCFWEACDGFFGHQTLEDLLPTSVLSKISMKQQAEEVVKAEIEGLESCSFCDFAYIPDPDDRIFKCQNPACMAETCRNCLERNHIPLRCTEIERQIDVEARKKIEEVMTNTLVRSCPNCAKKIIKIDGCNEIICVCGTTFCYICRKEVNAERLYDHFSSRCPSQSDITELHVRSVQEAGIQMRNELLSSDQGIRLIHDPTESF